MIISCEQCNARYLLASLLLGVSGRKVRCGVCGHTWFQEPVDEPLTQKNADNMTFRDILDREDSAPEPIPESVRPIPPGSNVPAISHDVPPVASNPAARASMMGGLAAAVIIALAMGGLFFMRGPIVQSWPPAALFFDIAGFPAAIPGEGLVFDQVTAKAKETEDGKYVLVVQGNVVNLHSRESAMPMVLATLLRPEGNANVVTWGIPISKDRIGPQETLSFTATYEDLPEDVEQVNVKFAVK